MIEAQKPEYWSEEGGFQAMRSALLSYLEAEDDILRRQKKRFVKFQGNVDTAAEAFTAAEAGNQEELARILAAMEQAQGGAPSAPTPAPSPITGATPPASATQAPPGGPARRRLRRPEWRRARHRAGSKPAVGHLRGTRRNPHG